MYDGQRGPQRTTQRAEPRRARRAKIGRPFDSEIGPAILEAAEQIMLTRGFGSLTVDAILRETGVSRGAFYRRYPHIGHLAYEVIARHFGPGEPVDTGTLAGDLLAVQRADIAVFADPLMRNNLPGLFESSRTDPRLHDLWVQGFAGPRRARVNTIVNAAIARGALTEPAVDLGYLCDLLVGPLLARTLIPITGDLDDLLARDSARSALQALLGCPSR